MVNENNQNIGIYDTTSAVQGNYHTYQQNQIMQPPKAKRKYSLTEIIFAWVCFLFGYLVCRVSPVISNSFGGFLFVLFIYIATTIFAIISRKKPAIASVVVALSAVIMNVSLVVSGNWFLHFWSYTYALVCYCYYLYSLFSCGKKKLFSDYVIVDFIKALFVMPFMSLGSVFLAIFSSKNKRSAKVILKLVLGIAVAIIPTLIVLALLSFDKGFVDILKSIFDFKVGEIFVHIGSFVLGVPIAMYIYSLFISSTDNKAEHVLDKEACNRAIKVVKKAPWITVLTAVIPLLFLYVVFFVSQWGYYISAFTSQLPSGFSYAQYAREGFFELCVVSIINLLIILSIVIFMKKETVFSDILLKLFCIIFSIFTLVLISTAIAKMVMYIDCYGLTQLRVYASWFMIILAIIFVLIMLRQFIRKFKAVAVSMMVVVVMFSILALSNVDEQIANYNVNRYFDNTLDTVDVITLYHLDESAIPSMIRLYEHLDKIEIKSEDEQLMYDEVSEMLSTQSEYYKNNKPTLFEFNLPSYNAQKSLEGAGF